MRKAYETLRDRNKTYGIIGYASHSEFRPIVDDLYRIYLHDEMFTYILEDVDKAFSEMFYGNGKTVLAKRRDVLLSLRSKPEFPRSKTTGEIQWDKHRSSCIRLNIEQDNVEFMMWDLSDKALEKHLNSYNKSTKKREGKRITHTYKTYKLKCDDKNLLQGQINNSDIYRGQTKISRIWKKGKWRYNIQITYETISPVILAMPTQNHKIGLNQQTETFAFVRDDALQGIEEMSPDTPRVVEEIKEIQRYLDNSLRAMNPELFDEEDGTVKYTKKEMKEQGLRWNFSKGYRTQMNKLRELYRKNTDERTRNCNIYAKKIISLGNWVILDCNQYKAWGTKLCRTSDATKEKYETRARKSDYTRQIHDRAPR